MFPAEALTAAVTVCHEFPFVSVKMPSLYMIIHYFEDGKDTKTINKALSIEKCLCIIKQNVMLSERNYLEKTINLDLYFYVVTEL